MTMLSVGGVALIGASAMATVAIAKNINDKKQEKKDEKNRPVWQIPSTVPQGLDFAMYRAQRGLPDEVMRNAQSEEEQRQAYFLTQSQTRKGGLVGIGAMDQRQKQFDAELAGMDATAQMKNEQDIFPQLENVTAYDAQEFQINRLNPFYEGVARRQARRNAFAQNMNNASQLGMSGAVAGGGGGQYKSTKETPTYNSRPIYDSGPINDYNPTYDTRIG